MFVLCLVESPEKIGESRRVIYRVNALQVRSDSAQIAFGQESYGDDTITIHLPVLSSDRCNIMSYNGKFRRWFHPNDIMPDDTGIGGP